MTLKPVEMHFMYGESFPNVPAPEAYGTLLLDVMHGDVTLFMRADQVEAAWAWVMPILDGWAAERANFPNYPAGTGPRRGRRPAGPRRASVVPAHGARKARMTRIVSVLAGP